MPYLRVLRMRATWTFAIANMLTAPVFWFYLYWLPPYLNQRFHLGISVAELGAPLIVIYLMADAGSVIGGALSSFMVRRGMEAVRAPPGHACLCNLPASRGVRVVRSGLWTATAYIAVAIAAHQAWTANIWSLAIDMTPKEAEASGFGLGGVCSAIGGMFMTQLVGGVLTRCGNNYTLLFTLIPAAYLIALAWMAAMRPRQRA